MAKTVKVYTAKQLKKKYPEAYDRAFQKYRDHIDEVPWSNEIVDSLKSLCKAAGVSLRDWSLGAYSPSYIRVEFPDRSEYFYGGVIKDLTGQRAVAWLENNLYGRLRIPWTGPRRWEVAKYGDGYRPGQIKPCPFTGVCYDEDYMDALNEAVRKGETLQEAFEGLGDTARHLLEIELDDEQSEERFLDSAEANDWQYTASGQQIY